MKLSYYLFNRSVHNFNQMIQSDKINAENNYFELHPRNNEHDFEFKVYIQRNRTKEPSWITFLERDLEIPNRDEIKNTVNSYVILIKVVREGNAYFFAVTGGFGFTAINKNNLENNFGLKVALNTIDSRELKAFDVRNIDLKTKQKRVLINKGSELGEFDLDFEQDLINLVSGKSGNEELGTTVRGSTSSLNLNSDVTFSRLGEKCNQILDFFLSDSYKEHFSFIDNIKIVKESSLIEVLNLLLFESLVNRDTDNITLTYPDMIEYEKCSKYLIKKGYKKVETEEVTINDLYNLLDDTVSFNTPAQIQKVKIIGFDDSDIAVTTPVTLNHFIVFQTEYEDDTYIFSLNNWYKIDRDYFSRIQSEIMGIPILEELDFLSSIEVGEKEGDYNEKQRKDYFVNLDKQNFQVAGSGSKIEICDLFSLDKHFVCVKKETRSATLSHLFAQGSVSMSLLRESEEYRDYLIKQVKNQFPNFNYAAENFPFNDCTLVYAISTAKASDIRTILPFFSKVNLLHHIGIIKRLGINVALYKIPIVNGDTNAIEDVDIED